MNRYIIIAFIAISLTSCSSKKELPTIKEVNIKKYSGTWYEIARMPSRFEDGLTCVTATYTPLKDGNIEVLNKGYLVENKTKTDDITGKAWVPDPQNHPGQLKVQFFWPFAADYYIISLDDDYQYALVGAPSRKYLWILARNKTLEPEVIDKLLEKARKLDFNTDNLVMIDQGCHDDE